MASESTIDLSKDNNQKAGLFSQIKGRAKKSPANKYSLAVEAQKSKLFKTHLNVHSAQGADLASASDPLLDANNKAPTWRIQERALELLEKPEALIDIPEDVYFGLKPSRLSIERSGDASVGQGSGARAEIKKEYLKRRQRILEALADGRQIILSTDFDGTLAYKNPVKVNNTRSIASPNDIHWLRIFALGMHRAGGVLEINTARPGLFAGPSIVSPEGAGGYRLAEEISGVLEEIGIYDLNDQQNKTILNSLVINGLNAGITHKPGKPVKIQEKTRQYAELLKFMNSTKTIKGYPKGFLKSLEDVWKNSEENLPMRILEYKAIPRYLTDHKEASFMDYVNYISLVQKSRKEDWTGERFVVELKKLNIPLNPKYQKLLEKPDKFTEERLTAVIRSGHGNLSCLTAHAIDADNVQRLDIKAKAYNMLIAFTRSKEVQEWAHKKYGIPIGTELMTINGRDISHIKSFDADTLEQVIADVKKGMPPAKDEWVLIDVKDNNQPYLEMAPNSKKRQGMTGFNDLLGTNEFTVGSGDSPSTDAGMMAQALINEGLGFKVRGLVTKGHIMESMVDLLCEERNSKHPFAMKRIDANTFETVHSPIERKTKAEWADIFYQEYADNVLSAEHIHLNNAFNALVFSEIFPDLKFKPEKDAPWLKEVKANANKRTLLTPLVGILQDQASGRAQFKKTLYEGLWEPLKKIPVLSTFFKDLLAIENSPPIFNFFLGLCSSALMGAGGLGVIAKLTKHNKLMKIAKIIERVAFGTNNIVSGVGRGLRQSIVFPLQFWGEMVGLASAMFPMNSIWGQTLRALSNIVLIGRSNEVMMRENYNLDTFVPEAKDQVDQIFGANKEEFSNIRKPAGRLTKNRMNLMRSLENGILGRIPLVGGLLARTVADFHQSAVMVKEFITVPALRKGVIANLFKPSGIPKLSKNSGKVYQNVHSPAHAYNFVGVMTMATSILSGLLGKITGSKRLDRVLTNLANILPSFGIVAAARLLEQDAAGDPRQFSGVRGQHVKFSPEKAGSWQRWGGWFMAAAAPFLSYDIGQLIFNMATGAYLKGIQHELPIRLDDSAINERRRTGEGFTRGEYSKIRKHDLLDFVRGFHGDEDKQISLNQQSSSHRPSIEQKPL